MTKCKNPLILKDEGIVTKSIKQLRLSMLFLINGGPVSPVEKFSNAPRLSSLIEPMTIIEIGFPFPFIKNNSSLVVVFEYR